MKPVSISQARKDIAELFSRVHYSREVLPINRNGKRFVYVISAEEFDDVIDTLAGREAKKILADPATEFVTFDQYLKGARERDKAPSRPHQTGTKRASRTSSRRPAGDRTAPRASGRKPKITST